MPAVDTTGAGDAFHAGYAWALAAAAGFRGVPALRCGGGGPEVPCLRRRAGLPDASEVMALLDRGARREEAPPLTTVPQRLTLRFGAGSIRSRSNRGGRDDRRRRTQTG